MSTEIRQKNTENLIAGPVNSIDGHPAVFDGVTGKLVKDGGTFPSTGAPTTSKYVLAELDANLPNALLIPSFLSSPDTCPLAPKLEDDEFNGNVLNPKWTIVGNTAATVNYNLTWPSHLFTNYTGSGDFTIKQTYQPAGAFSITLCGHFAPQANYQGLTLEAANSDDTNAIRINYEWSSNVALVMSTKDNNSWNYERAKLALPSANRFYLHLQRDGSNNWATWGSFDGMSYYRAGNPYNKVITVDHFIIGTGQGGCTIPSRQGIDWVRRDWVTL